MQMSAGLLKACGESRKGWRDEAGNIHKLIIQSDFRPTTVSNIWHTHPSLGCIAF